MKVLFADTVHPVLEQALAARGVECVHDYTSPYESLKTVLADCEGLVIRSRIPVDDALLASAKNLKFIARSGSGLENIDLASAKKRGIEVFSSPEGNRDAVGEHAAGMLLALLNRLHIADAQVRSGNWDREGNRGTELKGLTVGIIGYGHMGSAFAERLKSFSCRIIAHDKYKTEFGDEAVEETDLEALLDTADVVSIHLPLSAETHHYVNAAFITRMTKPFILINTARGQHVDTAALAEALDIGKVRGACLDVLEYEKRSLEGLDTSEMPAPLRALFASQRVILSPHVAGWTTESYIKLSAVLAQKLADSGLLPPLRE